MKKLLLIALVALAIGVTVVFAGSVFSRSTAALGASTGTVTWTNSATYTFPLELKNIWIQNSLATNAVVTVKRVSTIDSVSYTDTVGTVTCAANLYGNTASFTAAYVGVGDRLTFSSSITTGATAVIEYEVQRN